MRTGVYLLLLVAFSLVLPVTTAPAAGMARTWTVVVGGGIPDTAIVSNAFAPRTIEIAVGDTVKWEFQEPWTIHTVTFTGGQKPPELEVREGNKFYFTPEVFFPAGGKIYDGTGYRNSGVAPQGPNAPHFSYSLTFTKAGTYDYQCLLHFPPMVGKVIVKDRVSGSPAEALAQGKKQLAATLSAGQAAYAKWGPERQGGTVVLPVVGDPKINWTNLRFSREPLVVKRGTTVTWTMRDPSEIHTVTFTGGQAAPAFLILEKQQSGPPKVLENPKLTAATTSKTYDGTGYANSGILFPPGAPANLPKNFSLTFTKPGKYEYVCGIHAPWGMKGTIVVQ